MTLNADPGAITPNDAVRLSAIVNSSDGASTPSGSVDFYLGGLWLETVALSGSAGTAAATLTVSGGQFPAGSDIVTAYYGGDAGFNASSASVTITAVIPLMNFAVVPSVTPNPYINYLPMPMGTPGVSPSNRPKWRTAAIGMPGLQESAAHNAAANSVIHHKE
jgi:hypothetical protein